MKENKKVFFIVSIFCFLVAMVLGIWFYLNWPKAEVEEETKPEVNLQEETKPEVILPEENQDLLSYKVSGCGEKQEEKEYTKTRVAEKVDYKVEGGKIFLTHHLNYVCCAKVKLSLESIEKKVGYTLIKLLEKNEGEMCRCICDYEVKAEIGPLESGEYVVQIKGVEFENQPAEVLWEKDITILPKSDEETVKETLISFFDNLKNGEFEKALAIFELDDWQVIDTFSPPEERDNKAKVLENYCKAVGTCLKANVLEIKKEKSGEYNLVVQFEREDGSIFVLGPCCGETEETMPPQDKFDFKVKKIDGVFKVLTPPVYVP